MKVSDIKLALDQYNDNDLVFIKLGLGTAYRIDKAIISGSKHNDDLYEVKGVERDTQTSSMVICFE